MSELSLNQIDVVKLDLRPSETLIITVKNDDVGSADVQSLQTMFSKTFPKNRVIILAVGQNDDIKFTSVASPDTVVSVPVSSCSTGNFCEDCNCGKKEDFLNSQTQGE